MAKPRLIILIRHAQSEGNKNREIHQSTPDHRVKLTPDGREQALEAGRRLRKLLRPDDKLHFFTSPYRRTRETTEGILATLTSDDPEPSPFRRSNIKVYEEPRLREQDFGNFQPCSAEMERMWQERADYGHFFYRIPNGESAADAYDRVSGFNESLWRQFGEDDFASVCVLVTHGLMSRVFLMKWYHFTVEYFEDLRNVDHCEFLIMRKEDNGKYLLETKLRTWSELRRERALAAKDRDDSGSPSSKDDAKLQRNKTFVVQRRWGGCPDGCNHSAHYTKRHDLDALRQREIEREAASTRESCNTSPVNRKQRPQVSANSDDGDGDDEGEDVVDRRENGHHDHSKTSRPSHKPTIAIMNPSAAQLEAIVSSAEGTPSYLAGVPHMHLGRDFGGTYSGHASNAGSDTDASEDERTRHRRIASLNARLKSTSLETNKLVIADAAAHSRNYSISSTGSASTPGPGPFVNRLGDAPPFSDSGIDEEGDTGTLRRTHKAKATATFTTDAKEDDEDQEYVDPELDAIEAAENSVQGSVF